MSVPPAWRGPCGRALRVAMYTAAVVVPAVSLARVPAIDLRPLLLGVLPFVVGKYVLCPLRWRALSVSGANRRWHLRVFAEAELLGLLTPGHVGSDLWRVRRLERRGVSRPDALAEVGLDRLVGAVGLAAFVGVTSLTLPWQLLVASLVAALALGAGALALRRWRPCLVPTRRRPTRRELAHGLAFSLGYQATVCALLLGALHATGGSVSPLALVGAFGASQLAGALPGVNGASPKDVALVLALVGLGVPLAAAAGAVALKAAVAFGPALLVGGTALALARRAGRRAPVAAVAA